MTDLEAVLLLARSQLWVREVGGENRGQVVEEYLRTVHLEPGEPWCAAFVSWVGSQATSRWQLPLTGSCQALYQAAQHLNLVQPVPKAGAVFLLWHSNLSRFAHTGFVVESRATDWATIEGNTNPGGGREGYGVFARVRTFAPQDRFIHW